MENQSDEGIDFSHAMEQPIPTDVSPPQPMKENKFKKHKKLLTLILILLVLAVVQALIWYSNRPPKAVEKPKKPIQQNTSINAQADQQ